MKNQILFSIAIIAMLFFVQSCNKEQTQLTIESLQGSAQIRGKVVYNKGTVVVNGTVVTAVTNVPAAGQVILARVPYLNYTEGATGFKIFRVTTDAEGTYILDIPVGATELTDIIVEALPFYADHLELARGHTNVTETLVNVFYEATTTTITLLDLQTKQVDISYDHLIINNYIY